MIGDMQKSYIEGYYCRDDVDLRILNKLTNRRILDALREVHPSGLDVYEISEKADLPVKTVYIQQAELYEHYYVDETEDVRKTKRNIRGRPSTHTISERYRRKILTEEAKSIYDIHTGKKPVALPPGNVAFSEGFTDIWHKIVQNNEKEKLCMSIINFLQTALYRINEEHQSQAVKEWAPEKEPDLCCPLCGLNHKARDFMRAMMLYLLDQVEDHCKFVDFMRENYFLSEHKYEEIKDKCGKNI
jgi:hypothetical protein